MNVTEQVGQLDQVVEMRKGTRYTQGELGQRAAL